MRSINLIDKRVARPVQVYTVDQADIVGIKTSSVNNTECITFVRTDMPQVASVIDDINTNGDLISLVTTTDSSIVERISKSQNLIKSSLTTVRLYYNPTLLVRATLDNSTFK